MQVNTKADAVIALRALTLALAQRSVDKITQLDHVNAVELCMTEQLIAGMKLALQHPEWSVSVVQLVFGADWMDTELGDIVQELPCQH